MEIKKQKLSQQENSKSTDSSTSNESCKEKVSHIFSVWILLFWFQVLLKLSCNYFIPVCKLLYFEHKFIISNIVIVVSFGTLYWLVIK